MGAGPRTHSVLESPRFMAVPAPACVRWDQVAAPSGPPAGAIAVHLPCVIARPYGEQVPALPDQDCAALTLRSWNHSRTACGSGRCAPATNEGRRRVALSESGRETTVRPSCQTAPGQRRVHRHDRAGWLARFRPSATARTRALARCPAVRGCVRGPGGVVAKAAAVSRSSGHAQGMRFLMALMAHGPPAIRECLPAWRRACLPGCDLLVPAGPA